MYLDGEVSPLILVALVIHEVTQKLFLLVRPAQQAGGMPHDGSPFTLEKHVVDFHDGGHL